MGIEIKTVPAEGLEGMIAARAPEGIFLAMTDKKRLLWRACEIRGGRAAAYSGDFPEVIGWIFMRMRVLPRGRRARVRLVGQDNPWRIRRTRDERADV